MRKRVSILDPTHAFCAFRLGVDEHPQVVSAFITAKRFTDGLNRLPTVVFDPFASKMPFKHIVLSSGKVFFYFYWQFFDLTVWFFFFFNKTVPTL